jgi:hypothetical protein
MQLRKGKNTMDTVTLIRVVSGVLAVIVLYIIIRRRRRKAAE